MRRSPAEKKALSYARDRRNAYGQNDKASRKAISLRKRKVNRANRHAARQQLADAGDWTTSERAEKIAERVEGSKPNLAQVARPATRPDPGVQTRTPRQLGTPRHLASSPVSRADAH
jgi:hypothetical protein